jgi:hypothetical protein
MPIIKETYQYNSPDFAAVVGGPKRFFEGRVLRIEKTTETRNWSDTLDYSDHRTTDCTWALVWLGTHGVPPQARGRIATSLETYSWEADKARDLEVHEQYAWVDCTNLLADRNGYRLVPTVDSFDMQLLHGGPAMIEGLAVWEEHSRVVRAKFEAAKKAQEEEAAARSAAVKAKAEARQAKLAEKHLVGKAEADEQMARIPAKGTQVTVDGFTGRVFWTGVTKYRGTWNARAGVKDSKGNVIWVEAMKF